MGEEPAASSSAAVEVVESAGLAGGDWSGNRGDPMPSRGEGLGGVGDDTSLEDVFVET